MRTSSIENPGFATLPATLKKQKHLIFRCFCFQLVAATRLREVTLSVLFCGLFPQKAKREALNFVQEPLLAEREAIMNFM